MSPFKNRGRIGLFLLAAVLIAGLVWGFLPGAVPVDVATVTRGPLAVTVEEEGKTRLRERYVVSAPVAGDAQRIPWKAGDAIEKGRTLAVIDPAQSPALDPRSRAQAQAGIAAAEATLAAAQEQARAAASASGLAASQLERAEALAQQRFVSPAALDTARDAVKRTAAERAAAGDRVDAARHELAAARAALTSGGTAHPKGQVEVVSPVTGQVLRVVHESAGPVAAGQSLIEVGDPQSLEIEVDMLSTSAVKIAPGTPVRLERWGGDGTLEGKVRLIEPAGHTKVSALGVEEQRVHVIVDFVSPYYEWQRLGDGYRVEAAFVVWQDENALQVPAGAVFRHGDGWGAFAVVDGHAVLRAVKVGQRNGLAVQIREGLKAGDTVVAHPDDKIADGVRVRPRAD